MIFRKFCVDCAQQLGLMMKTIWPKYSWPSRSSTANALIDAMRKALQSESSFFEARGWMGSRLALFNTTTPVNYIVVVKPKCKRSSGSCILVMDRKIDRTNVTHIETIWFMIEAWSFQSSILIRSHNHRIVIIYQTKLGTTGL